KFLESDSFRNELADAAISAIRLQDDSSLITPLRETLAKKEMNFTSGGFARGLGALAYLARNEEKKDAVREFLTHYVNHKKQTIQTAAITALGTLVDPEAIPVLNKFSTVSKERPEQAVAERALTELRAARKPVDDFKN